MPRNPTYRPDSTQSANHHYLGDYQYLQGQGIDNANEITRLKEQFTRALGAVASTNGSTAGKTIITGGGSGITSIGLADATGLWFSFGPNPLTGNGVITITPQTQAANVVLAGPTTGTAATPTWRGLVVADIPNLPASIITSGQLLLARGGTGADLSATGGAHNFVKQSTAGGVFTVGTIATADLPAGTGTVTSVSMAVPTWASVTGSPITTSGTLALTLPAFIASGASHAPGIVPDPGASSGSTKFLREDATWAVPSGGGGSPAGNTGDLQLNGGGGSFGAATADGLWWDSTNNRLALLWKTTPAPIYSIEINNASTVAATGLANFGMYAGAASSGTTSGSRFVMGGSGPSRTNNFEIACNAAANDNFPGTTGGDASICHSGTLYIFGSTWTSGGTGLWASPVKYASFNTGNLWCSSTFTVGAAAGQTSQVFRAETSSVSAPQAGIYQNTTHGPTSFVIQNSDGIYQHFVAGAANNFLTGTAAGDVGTTTTAGKSWFVGDGTAGVRFVVDGSGNITATGTIKPLVAGGYLTHTGTAGATATTGGAVFADGIYTSGTITGATGLTAVATITSTGSISAAGAGVAVALVPVDCSGGNVTVTLPAASTAFSTTAPVRYIIKRIDASVNTVTIIPAGSDTIDYGTPTITLITQNQSYEIVAYSTAKWWIV